jgi:formamidopyrimidine-DNA glycosylase
LKGGILVPELPEVETICRSLAPKILGRKIVDIDIFWPPAVVSIPGRDFAELVMDRENISLDRRGKYLLIGLSRGLTMIIHFRMTGRMIYYPSRHAPEKHTHVVFRLNEGEVHYADTRKFGRIQLVPTAKAFKTPSLAKLGPEPLAEDFSFVQLGQCLSRKKSTIKSSLLDQRVIAGLGNIYVDEALFRAGIQPGRKTQSLKVSEIIKLYDAIVEVLSAGIKAEGTTFRDYRNAEGKKGLFQESLMVYGRGGLDCKVCGQKLLRQKTGGRTTVFCPQCQL